MEKVLSSMPMGSEVKVDRILEINPDHPVFEKLRQVEKQDDFGNYARLLYDQALLLAGLKIDDPVEFAARICKLMVD